MQTIKYMFLKFNKSKFLMIDITILLNKCINAGVAQLVEQLICNQ